MRVFYCNNLQYILVFSHTVFIDCLTIVQSEKFIILHSSLKSIARIFRLIKKRQLLYTLQMTTYLQILSLDTVDSSPSIVIATETGRLLFDSGEGIQRLCVEHKTRISKLDGIFLTRLCPETIGNYFIYYLLMILFVIILITADIELHKQ